MLRVFRDNRARFRFFRWSVAIRIDEQHSDLAQLRVYRDDIKRFLDQPGNHDARVCPGCEILCPICGSTSCLCICSPDCVDAPGMMSSEPERFPIEAGIAPLVYAFHSLRLTPPCWSCEGHYNKSNELDKLPCVWFYANSMVYPDIVSELLSELSADRRLSIHWHIRMVRWGDSLDITFSIEPRINPTDDPDLDDLRKDTRVIADSIMRKTRSKMQDRVLKLNRRINASPLQDAG